MIAMKAETGSSARQVPRATILVAFGTLLILLVYAWLRLLNLLALPAFIDETIYLGWVRDVRALDLLSGAGQGKLFGVWLLALLGVADPLLHNPAALWSLRAGSILISLCGAAGLYGAARLVVPRPIWAWAALVLYAVTPFAFLYDRVVTFDSWVTTAHALALYFALRFARSTAPLDAAACGLMLALAIGFKASGVFLIALPAVVVATLIRRHPRRLLVVGLLAAYGTLFVIWGPLYLFLRGRGWDYFGLATTSMGTSSTAGLVERVVANADPVLNTATVYLSGGVVGSVLIGAALFWLVTLRQRPPADHTGAAEPMARIRVWLIVLGALAIPLVGALAFATHLRGRYLLFLVPPLLLLLVIEWSAIERLHIPSRWIAAAIAARLAIYVGSVGWPFASALHTDLASAPLTEADRDEYVRADSAGYALPEVAARLLAMAETHGTSIEVIGLIANCQGLALYVVPGQGVEVECPLLTHTGSRQQALTTLIDSRVAELRLAQSPESARELVVVEEGLRYASIKDVATPLELVGAFMRPGNLTTVTIYRVR